MKLKTRLMVAFCIIIILPIALAGAAILGLYRIQTKADPEKLWSGGIGYPGCIVDSLQLMSRYTKTEYDEICKQAKTDPEKLESVSYLAEVNTKLQEKSSYLIFCKNGILVYNGIMEIQASVTSSGKNSSLPMARVTAARVRHIMWTMMRSRC